MNELTRRRALLAASDEKYVQDGLVLNLDGTDMQASSTSVWTDLAGGIKFTIVGSGPVSAGVGFSFNGSSSGLIGDRELILTSDPMLDSKYKFIDYTLECVIRPQFVSSPSWGCIVSANQWDQYNALGIVCVWNTTHYNGIAVKYNHKAVSYPKYLPLGQVNGQIMSCSLQYEASLNLVNGSWENTRSVTDGVMSDTSSRRPKIGFRGNNVSTGGFRGIILAVRIYNRTLTNAEREHNFRVDQSKYGNVFA